MATGCPLRIFKRLLLIVALLALTLFGAVFAANNPGSIPVDVGFMRFESVSMALAFAAAFAAGWAFGVACAAPALVRLTADRRRLRRRLEAASRRPESAASDDAY